MDRKMIRIEDFNTNMFDVLNRGWMLLTAGSFETGDYNTMTISWGMMGTFWNRPVVMVGVRPGRHTFRFMEDYNTFTLCAFPEAMRSNLAFCGAKSGRDVNKIKECKLTPIGSEYIEAPGFEQAELIIECQKLYTHQLATKGLNDKTIISKLYPERDFHKLYMGQVKAVSAVDKYCVEA